jgi:hypothetical protein
LVYISTVPFLMHSFIIEESMKNLSLMTSLDALYPSIAIERFDDIFGTESLSPVVMLCPSCVWSLTYRSGGVTSGVGDVIVQKRDAAKTVAYRETFEYDLT